jgi:hypothetical protein
LRRLLMLNGNKNIDNKVREVVSGTTTTEVTVCVPCYKIWSATEAALGATDGCHASIGATAAAQTITTAITAPSTPRNVTITCTKAGGGNMSGDVVITGTNTWGQTITDTIAEGADGTIVGVKAFKTVTSILVPVRVTAGDALTIGYGAVLGMDVFLPNTSCAIKQTKGGTAATLPTVVADADEIEKNTVTMNAALNGSIEILYYYIH